jgi:hypothetical protein
LKDLLDDVFKFDKDEIKKSFDNGRFIRNFEVIWKRFKETDFYFQFTLKEDMKMSEQYKDLLLALKKIFTTFPFTLGSRTDFWRGTLVLIGRYPFFTGFHVDWAEAINIALQLGGILDLKKVLAIWYFLNPLIFKVESLFRIVCGWFKAEFNIQNVAKWKEARFTMPVFQRLQKALSEAQLPPGVAADSLAFIVEQRHGDIVHVEPGFGHFVENVQPNIKFAFDFLDFRKSKLYVDVWHNIHPKLGTSNAKDYIGGENEICRMCLNLLKKMQSYQD